MPSFDQQKSLVLELVIFIYKNYVLYVLSRREVWTLRGLIFVAATFF